MSVDRALMIGQNHATIARLGELAGVKNPGGISIEGPFTDVEGLSHLESVDEIEIAAPLTTLAGLRNLTTAGSLRLIGTRLTTLAGLGNLSLSWLDLFENPLLRNLTGLSANTELGSLMLDANPELVSLTGLEMLTSLGYQLAISRNDSLTSLAGLENLTTVEIFVIAQNANLASVSALESLTNVGGEFSVIDNPRLPTCEVRALHDVTGGSPLTVMGNQGPTNCPSTTRAPCCAGER
jgi:hypothetical protein